MGCPRPADRRELQGGVGAPGPRRGRRSDRRAGSPRRLRRLGRRRNRCGTHRRAGHLVRTAYSGVAHCCCQPRAVTKPRVDPRPELPSLGTVSVARAVGQWMGHPARRGGRALDVWKADRPRARRRTQLDAVDLDVLALTGAPEQVVERAAGVAEAVGPEGDDDRRLELHATSIARRRLYSPPRIGERASRRESGTAAPLVDQRAAADVDDRRRHAAGPVRAGERGRVADILERRGPPEQRLPLDHLGDLVATLGSLRDRLQHPPARERDHADSVRAELDGELPPHRLDRVEGDLGPAQVVVAARGAPVAGATEGQDYARAPGDHVPRGRPGGQESRACGGLHRRHEVTHGHLRERGPVGVRVGDQVERDVDAAGVRRHGVGVLVDRVLVERVDLRCLRRSPSGTDLRGNRLERRQGAAGEEDPGALAGERPSNGAADRPAPSVDHGVLVLEQHVNLLRSLVSQSIRLCRMALPSTPTGRVLLGARTALGVSTLLAPRLAGKAFFLDPDDNPQLPVIGRMWGIRNLSLAAGMYAATGDNRAQWWRLQPAVDAIDYLTIATEWSRGAVPGPAAGLMAATALLAVALGGLSVAGESEGGG